MTALFIDCSTGLAGDMILAACLNLGVPKKVIEEPFLSLGFGNSFFVKVEDGVTFGIKGLRVTVEGIEKDSLPRSFGEISKIINQSCWKDSLKEKVLKVYTTLADAEGVVHGEPLEKVHFHELGSLEALFDVVGVCAAFEYLNPSQIICSFPAAGSGTVNTSHGLMPVPVPVVLELAKKHKINLLGGDQYPKGELTTPTGLALMACFSNFFGQPSSFGVKKIGVGLGHRDFGCPNFLRITLIDSIEESGFKEDISSPIWQSLIFQEAWIDDASAEDLSALINKLRNSGALEVVSQSVQMKKGRQGVSVKAILKPEQAQGLRKIWFLHSTTIGLREYSSGRWVLPRRLGSCSTRFGLLSAKQVLHPDGRLTIKPEHDELIRISSETGKSLEEVRNEFYNSVDKFSSKEDWIC